MKLSISNIRRDGATQARAGLDATTVADYAAAIGAGDTFPPCVVFYDGSAYWLADGFHRVEALIKNGIADVNVTIKTGTQRDAILHACGANADHGLRRTHADKRRAIDLLLRDQEWGKRSDSWIASSCRVDHKTVARVRADLGIPKSTAVEGKDGRTIDVTRIGKTSRPLSYASAVSWIQEVTGRARQAIHYEDVGIVLDQYKAIIERSEEIVASSRTIAEVRSLANPEDGSGLFSSLNSAVDDCIRRGDESVLREIAAEPAIVREAYAASQSEQLIKACDMVLARMCAS